MLTVITVLHNSADTVARTLGSVPESAEVIVVDNSSTDGGPEIARAARPDAQLLLTGTNLGFGAGCNAGAAAASGDILMFLNPDAVLLPGATETLTAALAQAVGGMVGPAFVDDAGQLLANTRRRSRRLRDLVWLLPAATRWVPAAARNELEATHPIYVHGGAVAYLRGSVLMLERETFERVGGFDEDFFLYSEEEELADRVQAAGGRVLFVPEAHAWHPGSTSTDKVATFALHHAYRSRVIFYAKRDGRLAAFVYATMVLPAAVLRALFSAAGMTSTEGGWSETRTWLSAVLSGLRAGLIFALRAAPIRRAQRTARAVRG